MPLTIFRCFWHTKSKTRITKFYLFRRNISDIVFWFWDRDESLIKFATRFTIFRIQRIGLRNTGTQYHQSTSINYVSDTYDFIHFRHFFCFRWFRLSPLRDALFCSALASSSPSVILLADQRSSKLKTEARTVLCRRIRRASLRVRTCLWARRITRPVRPIAPASRIIRLNRTIISRRTTHRTDTTRIHWETKASRSRWVRNCCHRRTSKARTECSVRRWTWTRRTRHNCRPFSRARRRNRSSRRWRRKRSRGRGAGKFPARKDGTIPCPVANPFSI